ncbi:hypothetical protein DYB28_003356 [Aphanomyces astaci]|uniref:UDP-N-acetylglucosamine transferase subunit ALG13 n=1 Tax=Aphanomyces astaci TaxID=112090 RepID=A0A9X8HCP4_APHAT|nr:hypothetical protein DYB28_003356 [Aphanomyces astaci]
MGTKMVFVTVGTTSFDGMVAAVDADEVHTILKEKGYDEILFQIGRGTYEPRALNGTLSTSFYRFNAAYKDDIRRASLVISHAGAGSIMDTLVERKHLIVIPNSQLMDNHQEELAGALAERHHLVATTCTLLASCLKAVDLNTLEPYPDVDEAAFPSFVDSVVHPPQHSKQG